MTLRELVELRQDAARLCADLARVGLALAQGLPLPQDLPEVAHAHPLACSADGLAQAVEALAGASGAARIARLASLRDFLVRARALALEPGAAQELAEFPRRPSVLLPGDAGLQGARAPVQVERELPLLRAREERAEAEAALAEAERGASGARSATWDAAQAALSEVGLGEPAEAAAALHDRDLREPSGKEHEREPIAAACERFLDETDDLARDLGGWLLERHTGAHPYPGGAERHDVLHLVHAPRCASAFPRGELVRSVRRWAEMLRLDLAAGGAIALDEDDRPLQPRGARAVAIDPPHEVRVVLLPEAGPRALGDLLGAAGVAQLRAGPPADAPPEDLWLGDAALEPACDALLRGLLLDPQWLRRCARADLGRDDERTIAVAGLLDARLDAARALASLEAHRSGLGSRTEQAMRELHARAVRAELPARLALRELDPWLSGWARLRGRALAARLREFLRERFDEDFWRNPRALAPLQALWARGGRPTAGELWAEVGGTPSLDPLAGELLRACA